MYLKLPVNTCMITLLGLEASMSVSISNVTVGQSHKTRMRLQKSSRIFCVLGKHPFQVYIRTVPACNRE